MRPETAEWAAGASVNAGESAGESTGESAAAPLEERFEAFVERHGERAVRLAWRLVGGDHAAAQDVAQEAFLSAYRALPGFRGEAKLETWFYRILLRRAHSHRRWRGVRELWRASTATEPADPKPRPHGDPALRARIGDALERLTRRQREVFVLVHMEGLSAREAAAVLGMPAGTLKSHLQRALRKLRAELGELREDPAGDSKP